MPESQLHVFFDYLPVSPTEAVLFVLTDIKFDKITDESKPDNERIHYDMPQGTGRHKWTFQTWKYNAPVKDGVVLKGLDRWRLEKWTLLAALPAPFEEPFHAFGRNGAYSLVTTGGVAYRLTLGTAKTKPRLTPIWTDAKLAIRAIVDDLDQERTFAFGNLPAGRDHFCIELNSRPSMERISVPPADPKDLEGRLKAISEFARIAFGKRPAGK